MRIRCRYLCKKCGCESIQVFEPKELCRNIKGHKDYRITHSFPCVKCGELPVNITIIKTSFIEEICHWMKLYYWGKKRISKYLN